MSSVSASAAAIPTNGVPSTGAAVSTPTPSVQAIPASQANPTSYVAAPSSEAIMAGGGGGFSAIAAYAQSKMNEVQANITALFKSEGSAVDAAKLQVANTQMSTWEMMMEQIAKLQEKQERAARVWVQM